LTKNSSADTVEFPYNNFD